MNVPTDTGNIITVIANFLYRIASSLSNERINVDQSNACEKPLTHHTYFIYLNPLCGIMPKSKLEAQPIIATINTEYIAL